MNPSTISRPSSLPRAILTVKNQDGHDEPVALLASVNEAPHAASEHYLRAITDNAASALWPYCYTLWTRNENGYERRAEWRP